MPAMDDMELLREYATRHSEQAFATLVRREEQGSKWQF
jgi:hypothetical protein